MKKIINKFNWFEWGMIIAVIGFTIYFSIISEGVGVYKNGFVSLMKCNQFSRDHFINFNDIFRALDESFYLGHHFYNGEYCECVDGVYLTDKDKMVEFYARMVKDCECPYTTQLVYTSDNRVTAGFGKKLLYK